MAILTRRQQLIQIAKEVGLDVQTEGKVGDNNTHYHFKSNGRLVHEARGLNNAALWLEGFEAGSRVARAKAVKNASAAS